MVEEQDISEMDSGFDEMPDSQISQTNTPELLKALISNESIPEKIKKDHWEIFNNDITLSFQDERSKQLKMLDFDLMKVDDLMATSWFDFNFEKEAKWNKLRLLFETKLDRATGFKAGGRINERLVQQTQFGEQKVVKSVDSQNAPGGILAGLLGRKR